MLDKKSAKRWIVGVVILAIVLILFNSSQRPIPSQIERRYDTALESISPALTNNEPIEALGTPVSISLEVDGGESFRVSTADKNITREQLFRLLQLINNTGLLAYSENDDYVLKVSIGEEQFTGSFSKDTLLATSARQSLAKLLSIYSKPPQKVNGDNNENKTGS